MGCEIAFQPETFGGPSFSDNSYLSSYTTKVMIFVWCAPEVELLAIVYTLQSVAVIAIIRNYFLFQILLHLMRNYFPVSMKQITLSGNSISRNTIEKIDAYLESDEKESSDSESIKITKDPCCEFEKKCSGDPRLAVTDGATVTAVDVCEPEKRRKKGHKRK